MADNQNPTESETTAMAPRDPRTPGEEVREEKRDPHLTYPADPPKGFDASGALVDKGAAAKVMADRKAILNPTKEDRPTFGQIEADRAKEQGK